MSASKKLRVCGLLVFCMLAIFCYAQPKCKIDHYTTEDGLSYDRITSIIKDSEGFMWFGTWDGINRYDGHSFVSYKSYPGDMSKLKNDRIDEIVEDGTVYLWLRDYDSQVYRFDKRTEQFLPLSDIIEEAKGQKLVFRRIISNDKGTVWLQTQNQGIFYIPDTDLSSGRYERFEKGLQKPFQLPSNQISFFYQDKAQNVWIGTSKGLAQLTKDNTGNYTVASNPGINQALNFTSFTEDPANIYFGTAEGDLMVYNKTSKHIINKKLPINGLNNILASKKRPVLYCSTADGKIFTIDPSSLNLSKTGFNATEPVYTMYEDQTGCLWVEPSLHGIIRFDPNSGLSKKFTQQNDASYSNGNEHPRVFEDNKAVVWVALKGGGFGYYNALANTFDFFYDGPDLSTRKFSNMINFIYYDKAGILWISADSRGLEKITFQGNYFDQHLLVDNSIVRSDNEVRGIYTDRKDRLWVGTKSGQLYVTQKGMSVPINFINGPKEGFGLIYSILQDHKGNIWLGTKLNGLFKAEPANAAETSYKISHFKADDGDPNSISGNDIYTLAEDNNGNIWIGTFDKGLNEAVTVNQKTVFINTRNSFRLYPKNSFQKIRHIAFDQNNNLWIGTTSGLLITGTPNSKNPVEKQFIAYGKIPGDKESLGNNNIQFILKDSKNGMWLATSGGGLSHAIGTAPLNHLKFKNYTTADGLPNDYLVSCIEDGHGNLWLATQKGISKFNISSKQIRNYDSDDGLLKTEFSEASCTKLSDGTLAVGSITGYLTFNPEKIIDSKIDASVVFTNLQVNNEDRFSGGKDSILQFNINYSSGLKLRYNQNNISIDYMLLNYRSVNKQYYAYRLTGFDTVWHNNRSQHRATYTNLAPGSYVFEVKALNGDSYSNQPVRSLSITILPPPWRTWWAYLLYFLLGAIVFEVVRRNAFAMLRLRQRIAVEQKLSELKLNFFTSVSHELRTPLTLILNPIQEIAQTENLSERGKAHVGIVQKNADRMVRFINQLLDLRKVQSGKSVLKIAKVEVVSFINGITGYFNDVALEKHIQLNLVANISGFYAFIDVEKIDIVIYNLLANAFKFSPNGKSITINVQQLEEQGIFSISISDEGNGVPEKMLKDIFELYFEGDHGNSKHVKGTGIGLALSKELVGLHHGKIWACNNQHHGLTVTVELLLGKSHFDNDEKHLVDLSEKNQYPALSKPLLPVIENQMPDYLPTASKLPLVLLVEDNADLQFFLKTQLSVFYNVEMAANGEDGLQKALEIMPDIILSDVMMPKMDGIQMLDKLKGNPITSHIPVVLLSAKSSIENQIEGLRYGADLYITKPFHNDLLLASIANILHQRKKIFESLADKKTLPVALNPSEVIITSRDELFLKQVIEIVEERMTDPDFNIDLVAETMAMGRSTFYKKFKSLTDLAPVEFIRDMRLKHAKQHMDAGETNIATIAYTVGFGNAKYFSTCFKEKFKLTPSEYLKANVKEVG